MRISCRAVAALLLVSSIGVTSPARATYSIVATDTGTRFVGGAGTSCVGSDFLIYAIFGSVPGRGVLVAQALIDYTSKERDEALVEVQTGIDPTSIIATITNTSFDSMAKSRQYGIVDLMQRAAGYTGAQAADYKEDRQNKVGTFTYSVQGNTLTGKAVLDQAASAFETKGCDLSEKLMLALEAGAENGQGDSRCTGSGIPSDGAFLQVDRPNEASGSYLKLSIDDVSHSATENVIVQLRAQFDDWRKTHPCVIPEVDAGADDGAVGDGSSADAGHAADASDDGSGQEGSPPPEGDGGCGCRTAAQTRGRDMMATWLAVVSMLALRRRRALKR